MPGVLPAVYPASPPSPLQELWVLVLWGVLPAARGGVIHWPAVLRGVLD
jgi:hypothetical protein